MSGLFGTVYDSVTGSPVHVAVESMFLALFVYMIVFRKKKSKEDDLELSEEEKDKIISEWKPQPLVPEEQHDDGMTLSHKIEGKVAKSVKIDGDDYLNLATNNFLDFVGNERIENAAKDAIKQYGVGSCGPRSFYGTVDIHLEAEKKIAQFMGCEEAVLYSFGFATVASAIPAYSKRGDIIYVDKACNFAVQKALQASRSRIEWFEHNDMIDLERLLKEQQEKDKKNPSKSQKVRKFIVVEGLYAKTADLCPLPRIMELKWKYKVRIFMDESLSFGVLGKRGRGVTDYYDVPTNDVDMIMVSLENGIGTTGGFTCGRAFVMGHQRLSGLGYCFSASLPPLLAAAAIKALEIIDEDQSLVGRLKDVSKIVHEVLLESLRDTDFVLQGASDSPLKFIRCREFEDEKKLDQLVDKFMENRVLVARSRFLDKSEAFAVQKGIKLTCNAGWTQNELEQVVSAIKSTFLN